MKKRALVENYVIEEITVHGRIPDRAELLTKFNFKDHELRDIDSKYHVLEHLWNFSDEQRATFIYKIAESEPQPADMQGLMYLIAQTALENMREKLRDD